MAIDIKSPQFPESIFEGTLSSWLKKEGQEIKQDEVLAEIETDKVVIEVTAPSDGVMGKVLVDEGAIIKSSEVIGSYKESAIENESKVVEETDVLEEQVELDKKAEEYIRDNSKLIKRLDEEYFTNIDFNISDLIKFIELKLEKLDKDLNYSEDMDPYEYEHFCANEFKKNGWDANATQGSSDQGVDVIAYKDGVTLVGQCKKYKRAVGNKAVQEVVAGIKFYDASIGIVIAPNGFTKSANALAEANDIKLIHHSEIKNIN